MFLVFLALRTLVTYHDSNFVVLKKTLNSQISNLMTNKHQIHNLIILDESGSMESIKNNVLQGFNEIVQTIKGIEKEFPDQEHFISMISFNGLGQKLLHFIDPASKLDQLNDTNYNPSASTPLYDAMGFGINKLKQYLAPLTDYNVLVTIFTDGEENASREFSGEAIKALVEELKLKNWTFTYIGTDHDVTALADKLSINNTMFFNKNQDDIDRMFLKERSARVNYSNRLSMKMNVSEGFYDDELINKPNNPEDSK